RTIGVACGAHILHDGYTDLLYVLLPVWQAEFGLGYAEIGALRAVYSGCMAALQMPAGWIAERIGAPLLLGIGTALAGIGFLVGLAAAAAILAVRGLPAMAAERVGETDQPQTVPAAAQPRTIGHGFSLLLAIAMIDSATRMGFLTFLPFLLQMKGADLPLIGI